MSRNPGQIVYPTYSHYYRVEYRDDPVVYENCVVKLGSSRRGRNSHKHKNSNDDDVYAKGPSINDAMH